VILLLPPHFLTFAALHLHQDPLDVLLGGQGASTKSFIAVIQKRVIRDRGQARSIMRRLLQFSRSSARGHQRDHEGVRWHTEAHHIASLSYVYEPAEATPGYSRRGLVIQLVGIEKLGISHKSKYSHCRYYAAVVVSFRVVQ
jgi:hypothetical protein